ncbi:MAG: putative thioesterase [Ramlibacter sp.]|nr:putative thioesterase [Ramlibacter sp.]
MSPRMNPFLSEELVSERPVVVRRRVKWGECDPAGVVYTPVFSEYAISAFQMFLGALLGPPLQEQLRALDLNTPLRALSFDFKRSLYPEQVFDMTVRVREVRNTTFALDIHFTDGPGQEILAAHLVVICVHHAERKSRAVPERLRELLEDYRGRWPAPALATEESTHEENSRS